MRPYAYKAQNTLETWLFFSDVVLVAIGISYSFLDPQDPRRAVLEPLLVTVLVGTLGFAAAYLTWHHRREVDDAVRTTSTRASSTLTAMTRRRGPYGIEISARPVAPISPGSGRFGGTSRRSRLSSPCPYSSRNSKAAISNRKSKHSLQSAESSIEEIRREGNQLVTENL